MQIKTMSIDMETKGQTDIIDITNEVVSVLRDSRLKEGNALVFVPGATAGITTIEYEPGLLEDYPRFFEKIIPADGRYKHNDTWHDGNGYSHVRASLQGASFQVPFTDGHLLLGTWQQIILVDFDNRPRQRKVIIQLIGN